MAEGGVEGLQRRGMRVVLAGWLLCLASILVGGLAAQRWGEVAPLAVGGFAVGFVLFWIGGHASARASDVGERLKWMKETTRGWNVAPEIDTWQPATTAQLRAVEDITDDHGGVAYVRGDEIRVVEVLARRGLRLHRLWVDEIGNRGVASIGTRTLRPLSAHVRRVESRGETWHLVKTAVPPKSDAERGWIRDRPCFADTASCSRRRPFKSTGGPRLGRLLYLLGPGRPDTRIPVRLEAVLRPGVLASLNVSVIVRITQATIASVANTNTVS